MSIFKNNKEEENRVAASEPHVEQESEVLSAEDVKNQDALVFYDITTRSIPAQTTPSLVLLLTQAEEAGEEL